ncbi:MAG: DUF86 domain-containing protein [Acidobacteria bacterium]|nr:DUF86 domain-containing protein [Acidobacteriota bacterium]
MSPRDLVYIGHMLDMAGKAVSKTRGLTRDAYDADETLRFALIHLVQVIGEAARHVSTQFADGHPEIPWADIIGMRHKVVHDYLGVDEDIVWQVVIHDVPKTGGVARAAPLSRAWPVGIRCLPRQAGTTLARVSSSSTPTTTSSSSK